MEQDSKDKSPAQIYLKQELNRLESTEKDAVKQLEKAQDALTKVRETIADFKKMLGIPE